jgi:glycosyltransferase involved in cell wall biosynthesis
MVNITSIIGKATILGAGIALSSTISRDDLFSKVENRNDTILHQNQFPTTTLILPTLNEEWMIERTLQSIKNQNIYLLHPEKFELLIVDSESQDNTIQIASQYVDKIIILPERDLVRARTIGIEHSKGDIIVFIDADTLYPINWLNTMLKHYSYEQQLKTTADCCQLSSNSTNPVIAVSGPEFHPNYDITRDIFEPILINLRIKRSNEMIGHNSSCYKWAFYAINGFDVPFNYDIKSSKDTQIVLETYFAKKLRSIGNYVYDKRLIVNDYGLTRRNKFADRKKLCNKNDTYMSDEERYLCQYWDERDKGIRF